MNSLEIESNRSLKEVSTFGIGGPAKYFLQVRSISEMQKALHFCTETNLPYFILGKGSNVLFDDQGFDGLVIANRIDFLEKCSSDIWHVGAGYSFSLLGSQTARQGYSGLEFASGIPGSVGGAVYMNAGANGQETAGPLVHVNYIDNTGNHQKFTKEESCFGYRTSFFQKMKGAIVSAVFKLDAHPEARQKQITLIDYRKKTQPLKAKSAGCIFRNPAEAAAGQIIEKAGLKGKAVGGAEISMQHGNFIVNAGEAKASDVRALIDLVRTEVFEKLQVELEPEVRFVPYAIE
ncbi:MAG: UDP-N-acetylmuramate dehydrogenase [Parachlamydia sp.]|jgi:UDP-N-acetylmuramate dehydrogenase|nr:UDP-N-acetylmuramate dehydrogenase [Parachlamydia sp.]